MAEKREMERQNRLENGLPEVVDLDDTMLTPTATKNTTTTSTKRKRQFMWVTNHDVLLLREILSREPFNAGFGKVTKAWEGVAIALQPLFKRVIATRSLQDRFNRLIKAHKSETLESMRRSGKYF